MTECCDELYPIHLCAYHYGEHLVSVHDCSAEMALTVFACLDGDAHCAVWFAAGRVLAVEAGLDPKSLS